MTKTIPSEDLLKTCKRCGEAKPLHLFPKDYAPRKRDPNRARYRPECKACKQLEHYTWRFSRREQMTPDDLAAYRKKQCDQVMARIRGKSPEEYAAWYKRDRAYWNARYKRLKASVYKAYGNVCACCGESEPLFLTIDHVHDTGKDHRKDGRKCRGDGLYKWLIDNGFPSDFQILCMNCNCGKSKNSGVCPHQVKRVTTIPKGSRAKWPEAHSIPRKG